MNSDIIIIPGVKSYKGHTVDEHWGGYSTITARHIPGYDGYYMGINGVAYSNKSRARIVRPLVRGLNGKGTYWHYNLIQDGKRNPLDAHRLMAMTYMGERPDGFTISHKNGNKDDNSLGNLCWETYSENLARKNAHGTHDKGVNNTRSKFTQEDVADIKLRLKSGEKVTHIARYYDCSHATISRINTGTRYGAF